MIVDTSSQKAFQVRLNRAVLDVCKDDPADCSEVGLDNL